MTTTTAKPGLPVWPTVAGAFASVPANGLAALRIFWAWGLILSALHVGRTITLLYATERPFSTIVVGTLLHIVVATVALASTAVAWHRLMLLGERPPVIYLRVGGQVPRYIRRLLLIGLVALPIQLLSSFLLLPVIGGLARPGPVSVGSLLLSHALGLAISLPAVVVMIRLSTSLPGVAIGRTMTLEDAWQLTKGSTLQLCGGTLLLYVPSYAIVIGVGLLPETQRGSLLVLLLLVGASTLSTIAAISFLSLSYRFLTGTAQPQSG
jgi:hypothetical protein